MTCALFTLNTHEDHEAGSVGFWTFSCHYQRAGIHSLARSVHARRDIRDVV